MADLCEGGNEPSGSLKGICKYQPPGLTCNVRVNSGKHISTNYRIRFNPPGLYYTLCTSEAETAFSSSPNEQLHTELILFCIIRGGKPSGGYASQKETFIKQTSGKPYYSCSKLQRLANNRQTMQRRVYCGLHSMRKSSNGAHPYDDNASDL
ncbi:hypothetical protein ANN_22868 [Periplaneta americana]|uniref:Uncharacterized protein n=1 Tax=Periplaneta americana TaxID=6978 RepID=A0ABQ8SJW1_PERAM|nr:hypothetical protein ANN_22868 [Periplaneta americana]